MKRQLTGLLQNAWPNPIGRVRRTPRFWVRPDWLDVSGRAETASVFCWGALGVAGRIAQPKGRQVPATELTVN